MGKFMLTGMLCMATGLFASTVHAWGGKKNDEDNTTPQMPKGKDAVDMARAGFRQAAVDPDLLNALMTDLKDPEMMKEVEKLLKDEDFQKEMNKVMGGDDWQKAYGDTIKSLSDPEVMKNLQTETEAYIEYLANGPEVDGKRDAAKGLESLGSSVIDADAMQEALAMLGDPGVMQKVQKTMSNPQFQKDIRELMDSPEMQEDMAKASEFYNQMLKDPELMARVKP